jgi:hypothetical protein
MARPALPLGQGTRVFSGARTMFVFNGEVVGYASGVSGSKEIQYEPVDTLDHLEVREHVPVGFRVTLTAQVFRTVSTGAGNDSINPGSLEQQQIMPKFGDIFRVQGVEAIIQDDPQAGSGGKILAQYENVKTASYNFNIAARSIVGQNVSFVTTMMKDESEITL